MESRWQTASRDELIAELERQQREIERLRRENERADRDRNRYRQQRDALRKKIDRLEDQLDEARRKTYRQAAPFARCAGARRPPTRPASGPGIRAESSSRDRYRVGAISAHGLAVARGHLHRQLNGLIDRPGARRVARNFAAHLAIEFPAVFTFLLEPDAIDATNWRAEHALRPAVVTRKVCGGNRSERGAQTQQTLASLLQTIHQRRLDATPLFDRLLRSPRPTTVLALPTAAALH